MSLPIGSLLRTAVGRHGLGLVPDPKGHGHASIDKLGLASVSAGPYTVERFCGPVRDQFGTSSCVAQAILDAEVTTLRARYGISAEIGSRLQLYRGARVLSGGPIVDLGCHPSDALRWLDKNGIAPESQWPFSVVKVNAKPPVSARWDARERRGVRGSYMAYDRGDQLVEVFKSTLASMRVPCIGIPVDEAMLANRGPERLKWENRGVPVGLHMVNIVALDYLDGEWCGRIRNSWGPLWRASGYAYVSQGYLMHPVSACVVDPESAGQ